MKTSHTPGAGLQAQCLCGAVTLRFPDGEHSMSACHCNTCRRWTGGPFMAVEYHAAPEVEGWESVRIFASSEWAERGFCLHCGTHLFYRLRADEFYSLPAGLFAESAHWPFDLEVFIDEKPDNYQFANDTRKLTGEEVFKNWSP